MADLLKRLQAEPNDGSMLYEWGLGDGNYAGVAILHDIPVGDMADLLLVDSRFKRQREYCAPFNGSRQKRSRRNSVFRYQRR